MMRVRVRMGVRVRVRVSDIVLLRERKTCLIIISPEVAAPEHSMAVLK